MTPDWPELWQREPGLIPEQVSFLADHEYLRPSFDALCRDAAIRWMVKNDGPDWYERLCFGLAGGSSFDEAVFDAAWEALDDDSRSTSSSSAP